MGRITFIAIVALAILPFVLGGFVIDTKTGHWINTVTNATMIFHGVNAVMKGFPWHPRIDSFNPSDSLVDQVITSFSFLHHMTLMI
jgi:hypothetical protein